jgi:superfamily I DNA and/or RNA helicase
MGKANEKLMHELANLANKLNKIHDHVDFVQKDTADNFVRFREECILKKEIYMQLSKKDNKKELTDFIQEIISLINQNTPMLECFLVQRAQLVFATLITSGRKWLQKQVHKFDIIVLDEAAAALVPEALIPLKFAPDLYIQIGDHKQLSPHCANGPALDRGFNKSMMHWMLESTNSTPQPYRMLDIQYRMDSLICSWPSKQYYDNLLQTADEVNQRSGLCYNDRLDPIFRPSMFFDIKSEDSKLSSSSNSISNQKEAEYVIKTVDYLIKVCGLQAAQIGVITFYSAQVELLKTEIKKIIPIDLQRKNLLISTVDSFQGGERDVILVSTVRTCESAGFLKDSGRVNVALTRSKFMMCVFGFFKPLSQSNSDLAAYAKDHKERGLVIEESTLKPILWPPVKNLTRERK